VRWRAAGWKDFTKSRQPVPYAAILLCCYHTIPCRWYRAAWLKRDCGLERGEGAKAATLLSGTGEGSVRAVWRVLACALLLFLP